MVSPQGRNICTVDDLVPYVDKLAIISEEQERITEPVSHGPTSEREFPAQEFHILQSSVETRGIGRRREPVEAKQYSQQMMERGHGMYYTPTTFSEYPSQMYQIFLQRLSKQKRGDNAAAEEILIIKREDGIDHVAHPHDITDTIMTDFHVSV
ncbi:hypothetical protein GmHk_14G039967 [Glycine max]|nr:hypothetical protein GmHk_14G039967 [Glycine max]